jgi:hypothetical protein
VPLSSGQKSNKVFKSRTTVIFRVHTPGTLCLKPVTVGERCINIYAGENTPGERPNTLVTGYLNRQH